MYKIGIFTIFFAVIYQYIFSHYVSELGGTAGYHFLRYFLGPTVFLMAYLLLVYFFFRNRKINGGIKIFSVLLIIVCSIVIVSFLSVLIVDADFARVALVCYGLNSDSESCVTAVARDTKNAKLCNLQEGWGQKFCIVQVGIAIGNAEVCDDLTQTFNDGCYLQISRKLPSAQLCRRITDENFRKECEERVKAYSSSTPEACMTLRDDYAKNGCLLSIKNIDESYCSQISDPAASSKCGENVQLVKNPESVCGSATTVAGWNCYMYAALSMREPALCSRIDDVSNRNYCYSYVADGMRDPQICENILREGFSLYSQVKKCKAAASI